MRWSVALAIAAGLAACSGNVGAPVVDLRNGVSPTPSPTAFTLDVSQPYEFRAERASQMGGSPQQILIEQNGQTQTAVGWDCYWLERVEDFDHDDLDEALVSYNAGCGGNCCGSQYFFVDVAADGTVWVTDRSVSDWTGPDIVEAEDGWRITVVDPHAGFNTHLSHTTQTFTLADGRFVELERIEAVELPSIAEIRSKAERTTQLVFDLNLDGINETVECPYWDRWGVLHRCELRVLGEPDQAIEHLGGKRIGVLASTTNGWHDLVTDFDAIYRWDGETYVHSVDG